MNYNPNFHNRQSHRLKGYDYSQEGMYFITMCTKDKYCLFGEVVGEDMILNVIGKIAEDCWLEIPKHFPQVVLDEYMVMPNHLHGILYLKQNDAGLNEYIGNTLLGTSHVMSLPVDS